MEDYLADLERKGIPFESDARKKKGGTVPLSGVTRSQNRPSVPNSTALGSTEYFDGLKKNAQFLSSSSMKKSKSGSGELGKHGTKFEYLGSTPYSQGDAPKSGSQKSTNQSLKTNTRGGESRRAAESLHNVQRKATGTALTRKLNTPRNGQSTVISSSEEDSSDELNITESSQPIETRANKSSRVLHKAIDVSESESGSDDDASWQRKMHPGMKGARAPSPARTSRNSKKPVPPPKSKARNDENSFSDETPSAKKTKVKPRPAFKGKSKADSLLTSLDSAAGPSSLIKPAKGSKLSAPLSPNRVSVYKQTEATPRPSKVQKGESTTQQRL